MGSVDGKHHVYLLTRDKSMVSVLESREQRYNIAIYIIKAIISHSLNKWAGLA